MVFRGSGLGNGLPKRSSQGDPDQNENLPHGLSAILRTRVSYNHYLRVAANSHDPK